MKATELRIGNYYQENGKTFRVDECDIVNLVRHENTKFESDMQAIPLTEEWLLKLGFDPSKPLEFLNVLASYDLGQCGFKMAYSGIKGPVIHYVHQLQNIHHALTGKELEWKS